MKSLKQFSLNLTEEEYHNLPVWSYSIIANYARNGFPSLATLHQKTEPTPAMKFGSLFDRIVTGEGMAKDEYAVCNIAVPESEKKMLDCLSATTVNKPYHMLEDDDFKQAQEVSGYQPRWGLKAVKEHLDPYVAYYELKVSGKEIVSSVDWNDAVEMASAIHNNEYLKDIFGENISDDIEYVYQAQFKKNICIDEEAMLFADVKIMPDLMVVNHNQKTIQPVDLKSSSMPGYQFAEHFVKMRYDLQAQTYVDVLQEVINDIPEYKDYLILPYLFVDVSRVDKVPVAFEYDPRSESQINGLTLGTERQYTYKNWKQLLLEIIGYEETEAVVPSYITTVGPNNLLDILNYQK